MNRKWQTEMEKVREQEVQDLQNQKQVQREGVVEMDRIYFKDMVHGKSGVSEAKISFVEGLIEEGTNSLTIIVGEEARIYPKTSIFYYTIGKDEVKEMTEEEITEEPKEEVPIIEEEKAEELPVAKVTLADEEEPVEQKPDDSETDSGDTTQENPKEEVKEE